MGEMDAYKDVFLEESAEYLQSITEGLLALECSPHDLEPVETVFRGAHSLKGMSAAMEYARTADLTHRMEGLMHRVRSGELPVTPAVVDLMLSAVDQVRALIDDESAGTSGVDVSVTLEALAAASRGEMPESPPASTEGSGVLGAPCELPSVSPEATGSTSESEDGSRLLRVVVSLEDSCVLKAVRAYMVIKRISHMGTVVDTVPSAREIEDERFERSFEVVVETLSTPSEVQTAAGAVSEIERVEVTEIDQRAGQGSGPAARVDQTDQSRAVVRKRAAIPKLSETQTVRISIGHLDSMVDLVGEIVTLRARLDDLSRRFESKDLYDALEELHRVSGELQHEVMQTRMVPVGNIFNRFPRMVRDLARDLGKDVELELNGLDIELDRTVLDEIGDPIVHLLRNSVDHGIESAEERRRAGKPERGLIRLEAARERDTVRISVSDDGKGMDPDRIWGKAVSLGLVSEADREACSLEDILFFACVPGFSTMADATKVSGRGVGMDVVKGKIEHLGGALSIDSAPGLGTTFSLTLPLTLAIIQALLVGDGQQTYALPLPSVDTVVSPSDLNIKTLENAPVVVLGDGQIVPLQRLDALMGGADPFELPKSDEHIVVLQSGTATRALTVQRLSGRMEIVIKPMSGVFRDARGFVGAAVLGDGTVALVLDPRTLFDTREESGT